MTKKRATNTTTALVTLNREIAQWEQRRDKRSIRKLDKCLSATLLFRRADGTVVDKKTFMDTLSRPSPFARRTSRDVVVKLMGQRALITLTVIGTKADRSVGRYRNVRVFVRRDARWQLDLWFNDDVTSLPGLLGIA